MSAMRPIPCTITAAADGLSNAIDLEEQDIVGFVVSAAWTAAAITFLSAPNSTGTYGSCYDDSNAELTVASAGVVAGRTVLFADALQCKLRGIKLLTFAAGESAVDINLGLARHDRNGFVKIG